jgi:iron complex transport system ATP-binding protein
MSSDPMLQCRDLTCGYGGKPVVKNLSLTVRAGEVVALLGPNGSGKSTLLKAISKTLPILSGDVLVQGASIRTMDFNTVARRMAFVPQEEPATFPFKVRDVVTLGRLAHSSGLFDTAEDYEAATGAMIESDCIDLEDRPITELSGGEKQRVLIARALAQHAPLLLLDEPTAHLDVRHQLSIARTVRAAATGGTTVLAAIHDLNLASIFADRAILIANGEMVQEGGIVDVLSSVKLDEVYGVTFERIPSGSGCVLVPESLQTR